MLCCQDLKINQLDRRAAPVKIGQQKDVGIMERIDREIAEAAWLETWEEMSLDDHLISLWEAAQVEAEKVNNEALAIVSAGDGEREGIF
jgi:hypothetical protein